MKHTNNTPIIKMNAINNYKAKNVMIVDDCPIDNFINEKMIRYYKFSNSIDIYISPLAALQYLKNIDEGVTPLCILPCIILLDIDMPIMNGHEFISEFSKLSTKITSFCKIVILSSLNNPSDVSKAFNCKHVFAYMSKPLIKSNLDELDRLCLEYKKAI